MAEKKDSGVFVPERELPLSEANLKIKAIPSDINAPPPTKEGLARFDLLRRGRQGKAGSPGFYSLSHGVGFQPNAVTAPRRGAYNMEIYKFRKHLLALKKELKKGLPKKICGKRVSMCFLGNATVWR